METIQTTNLIPVDLNSVLCAVEFSLAYLSQEVLQDPPMANTLLVKAKKRQAAIDELFWDQEIGLWFDYDIKKEKLLNKEFYASSIFPLWAETFDYTRKTLNSSLREIVYNALRDLDVLTYPGGLPTSLVKSGQQWDFPNAWAPLQHVAVNAFDNSAYDFVNIKNVGKNIARKFVENAYLTWKDTGNMYEKYNVETPGRSGGGGEYGTQIGFGWTNGVVLDFLDKYGGEFMAPADDTPSRSAPLHAYPHGDSYRTYVLVVLLSYIALMFLMGL